MKTHFFATSQFWVSVVTTAFLFFLVATFVFGWNPPAPGQNPGQGGGAVQVNAQNDIFIELKPISGLLRKIKNVANPTEASDVATRGWVLNATAGQSGIVTLWGRCQSQNCEAGENSFGPNSPETVLNCASLGEFWTELYRGFGPHVVYDDVNQGPGFEGTITFADSTPVCRAGAVDENQFYVGVKQGTPPVEYKYRAKWSVAGAGEYANTCVVCAR